MPVLSRPPSDTTRDQVRRIGTSSKGKLMRYTFSLLCLATTIMACGPATERSVDAEVNVYTHRHYGSDKQLFARFTELTGIAVNVIQAGDDELMARLEAEGQRSPCDVFITADAGRLGLAMRRGLLRPTRSVVLEENIPPSLRDPEGHWFGLTRRARAVAYHKEKVDPASIRNWDDLTAPEWEGRVLVRSAENIYNQSLVAAMIAHHGTETAEDWARGIVRNMARKPVGGDTDQLLAVAEGLGDVAIANSYYIAKIMASDDPAHQKARAVLGVTFPVIAGYGVHVNVSGGGVARHAPHPGAAARLLEFLSGSEAQAIFAQGNMEYPVLDGIPLPAELAAFGTFDPDDLGLEALNEHNRAAAKVLNAAGWR